MKSLMRSVLNFSFAIALLINVHVYGQTFVFGLVDGYSSWSLAPSVIEKLSPDSTVKWILIQTHPYTIDQERFVSLFPNATRIKMQPMADGKSVEEVAEFLKSENVDTVFGGMDEGASRSPAINEILEKPDNPSRSVSLRRDKDKLDIAADKWAIPKLLVGKGIDEWNWLQSEKAKEVVIKYTHGANGNGIRFHRLSTVHAFNRWLNTLGHRRAYVPGREKTDQSIIMPRIRGRKFFANTYTFEGRTILTAVGEYFMIELDDQVYYFLEGYLDLDSEEALAMKEIIDQTYPKFEIHHGPAHPEFVQDEETGKFYYIEMNARIIGIGAPEIESRIYGYSHLDLHLLSALDPARLRMVMNEGLRRRASAFTATPNLSITARYNRRAVEKFMNQASVHQVEPQYQLPFDTDLIPSPDQAPVAGAMYFVGSPQRVRESVEGFYDHIQRGSFFKDGGCSKAFGDSIVSPTLGDGMKKAFEKIDWRKF